MSPELWPNNKSEATRYTDLSRANAFALETRQIGMAGDLPAGRISANGSYNLAHTLPAARATSTQNLIISKGAEVTLIETIKSAEKGVGVARQQSTLKLEEGARLTHIRLQQIDASAFHWSTLNIELGRDAHYQQVTLNLGAALARQEIVAKLVAPGAHFGLAALQLLGATQHGDITTQVFHDAPHTSSSQLVKNVLSAQARGVYQGQIRVAPGAQKTDGQQQSRALLLSAQAEMNTKPELEIFADDVKCSHGAALGALDDKALFYMRARGISEGEARSLLIAAFIGEVLEQAPEAQRAQLDQEAQTWLRQL